MILRSQLSVRGSLGLLALALALAACGGNEAAPASPASTAATATSDTPKAPATADTSNATPTAAAGSPTPATNSQPSTSGDAVMSGAASPQPADKTFKHSKLPLEFSYPDWLTAKEEPKGATVESAKIASVEDRSGKSKGPVPTSLLVRVTLEDGSPAAVAKKTNPGFANAFPKGEASFKEEKGFADKITVNGTTGYEFTMGSHGSNERDSFVPTKDGKKTAVVKCSYTGDSLKPSKPESDQLAACSKVVSTLKL